MNYAITSVLNLVFRLRNSPHIALLFLRKLHAHIIDASLLLDDLPSVFSSRPRRLHDAIGSCDICGNDKSRHSLTRTKCPRHRWERTKRPLIGAWETTALSRSFPEHLCSIKIEETVFMLLSITIKSYILLPRLENCRETIVIFTCIRSY